MAAEVPGADKAEAPTPEGSFLVYLFSRRVLDNAREAHEAAKVNLVAHFEAHVGSQVTVTGRRSAVVHSQQLPTGKITGTVVTTRETESLVYEGYVLDAVYENAIVISNPLSPSVKPIIRFDQIDDFAIVPPQELLAQLLAIEQA